MAFQDTLEVLFERLGLGLVIPKWSKDRGYDFEQFLKIRELDNLSFAF